MRRPHFTLASVVILALSSSCTIPRTVDRLQDEAPPPEFGRPTWVRTCAGFGAWIGGIAGGVVSIGLLPVTYPMSLLAGDHLGEYTQTEFLLFPAVGLAAAGHALLGTPPDLLDYTFRRAWSSQQWPESTYDLVPLDPPGIPQAWARPADVEPLQIPPVPADAPVETPKDGGKAAGTESGKVAPKDPPK